MGRPFLAASRPAVVLAVLLVGPVACAERAPDDDAVAAVRAFVGAMVRSKNDRGALREAYELLDRPARRALARRAEEATALSGRRYHPWDMLPQGRFRLRFAPRSGPDGFVMVSRGEGKAVVRAQGRADAERAEIPVVDEDGVWRVHLAIPPVASRPNEP